MYSETIPVNRSDDCIDDQTAYRLATERALKSMLHQCGTPSKLLDMPDVLRIFQHGAITGELANPCHVQDGLPSPCHRVLIGLANGVLRLDIGRQVGEMKIAVALFQEGSGNPGKESWLIGTEEVRGEGVHHAPDRRRADVIRLRVIAAMSTQFLNLLRLQAKNKNVLLLDFLHDLDIGSIE